MPPVAKPAPDFSRLHGRLAGLRARLRMVSTLRGAGWLLTAILATAVVFGALDWLVHLPGFIRGGVLVATLAGSIILGYRYLFKPLSSRVDDLSLALRVEEAHPTLNDSLGSTVEFLQQGSSEGDSAQMRQAAMHKALLQLEGTDFNRVVDSRGLWPAVGLGALSTVAALALFLIFPALAFTALVRLADPFGDHEWPKKTQIALDEPRQRVGKGEVYEVRGTLKGVIPERAVVTFKFDGQPAVEHVLDVSREDQVGRFATKLESGRVTKNFSFQVRANDNSTRPVEVTVLPPPVLVALDGQPSPQLQLFPPPYTPLPSPSIVSPGNGNVDAVTGTVVSFRARADRPLAKAWIEYVPENKAAPQGAMLAPLGADSGLGAVGSLALSRTVWDRVPAELEGDRSVFRAKFLPPVNGLYALTIVDDTGLSTTRTFELRLKLDPAPAVQLERPSPSKDILSVLPDAVLPIHVLADDEMYGVKSVTLLYRTNRAEPQRALVLYDSPKVIHAVAMFAGPGLVGANLRLQPMHVEYRQNLSLRQITHPGGTSLRPGDMVLFQAAADDYDDVTPDKQPGRSHEVEVRIVAREDLELTLNQAQANVQQELLRLREKERDALARVLKAEKKLKQGERLQPEDLQELTQAEQMQAQINERIGDEKEGLRAEVARIQRTLRQNNIDNSGVRERMADVARELDRLAENELPKIEPGLNQTRKFAELSEDKPKQPSPARLELEKKAREAQDKAKAAEQAAKDAAADAQRLQEEADKKPQGDPDRARLEKDAAAKRQQAKLLEETTKDLKAKAEQARQEAEQANPDGKARETLNEARRRQEEVEKTLNDLLSRMEPWANSREIKGEAGKILQEQRRLKDALAELQKDTFGKSRNADKEENRLTARQQMQLDDAANDQLQLEQRMNQLLDKMDRMARDREGKDPETAQELREARNQGLKDNIPGLMKEARENTKNNNTEKAQTAQKESIEKLQKMLKTLEDRREAELDRIGKKLREAEKKLDELTGDQERLQKKIEEAKQIADPAEREAALKKLTAQQEKIAKQAEDLLKELSRLRAGRASQALGQAQEEMQLAGRQLQRGGQAEDQQDEILDRLDEAFREIQQARKQAEDELEREKLGRIADTIKRYRDRQESIGAEATRIQTDAQKKGGWRSGGIAIGEHSQNQKILGDELEGAAKKDLAGTPVFARVAERSVEAMRKATARMMALKETADLDLKDLPDRELTEQQAEALRRLDQILKAVNDELKNRDRAANNGGGNGGDEGNGGGGGGGGGGPEGDGLPPVAQLKLLRLMQIEVNERTEAFKKDHPDAAKWTDKDKAEFRRLQQDQQEVAGLLELMRGGEKPEPKDDK